MKTQEKGIQIGKRDVPVHFYDLQLLCVSGTALVAQSPCASVDPLALPPVIGDEKESLSVDDIKKR